MPSALPPSDQPQALARGSTIGRYVVLGLVGRGGMGEVYAAYDPELDRKVAVKLLRIKPGAGVSMAEGRQRTLREAQAIARLSHANVVVVYDVGTFKDQVFIAMEFVDGNTVTYWVQAETRTWQEILKVFIAAGRGLIAAHEKGLVHRDFKPDNVMVGRDGQVRVMDFGLARQMNEKGERHPSPAEGVGLTSTQKLPLGIPDRPAQSPPEGTDLGSTLVLAKQTGTGVPLEITTGSGDRFGDQLTRTGAMMGTPAYMAPEQFLGTVTDARTDQFSFCVALYEALYGERPFGGNTMFALTSNVVQGKVREPPTNSNVPLWLRKVLLRGLRPTAADRFPSMVELIQALEKNPVVQRRNLALVATGAMLAVGLGFGVRQGLADHRSLCNGGPARLMGVWEVEAAPGEPIPARQSQVKASFLRTGKSYASDVFTTVSRSLTSYAKSWVTMYREACEATGLRGEQSAEVLDLRMSCLQERLGGLRALTNVFSDANGEVVENAVSAVNSLGSLDRCADVPLLRAVVRPPEDPNTRALVADLRHQLADLRARFNAGRWKEAMKSAPRLVAEARAVGYQPLVAETLALHGTILFKSNDTKAAEAALTEAFWAADASRHDEVRAEVATNLVYVVGYQAGNFASAQRWSTIAEAVLQRLGGHELLQSWLLNNLGCVYDLRGDRQAQLRAHEKALALKEKALGRDHPDVAVSEGNVSIALAGLGRNQEALTHVDRSILVLETGLGSGHPDLAVQLSNRGEILNNLGRYREARQSFERARVIWERELGLDDRNLGYALTGIGLSYLAEGTPTSALVPLERAYKIRQAQETDPSHRAETLFALARALWDSARDRGRARALANESREAYRKADAKARTAEVEAWLRERGVEG
jgi:serine/threonine protein kinase/tetratricopeptide (TPR) repeat protein